MGLFEKIFSKLRPRDGNTWQTLQGYSDANFVPWNGDIFESELVRASLDARARHMSKLAVQFDGVTAQTSLVTRLKQAPNSWQGWSQFLYRLSVILDMDCTAFIVPVYNDYMERTGISVIKAQQYQLIDVGGSPWIRFRFGNGQIASDELGNIGIMTRFQYTSDYFGTDNYALTDTLKLIDIQRQGIENAAENSGSYRFIATLGNFAKPEDLAKERKRFSEKNFASGADAGGLLLFPNTYKDIKELSQKQYSVDAEETKLIQERVYSYFGVNTAIIQNTATSEQMNAFYEGAVEPFAVQLGETLTRMLFTPNEISRGNSVQISADRLSYMSTTEKISLIQQMSDRGMLKINEGRRILNLPDLPDGDHTVIRGEYQPGGVAPDDGGDEE